MIYVYVWYGHSRGYRPVVVVVVVVTLLAACTPPPLAFAQMHLKLAHFALKRFNSALVMVNKDCTSQGQPLEAASPIPKTPCPSRPAPPPLPGRGNTVPRRMAPNHQRHSLRKCRCSELI